jgi:hypothetical protein
MAITRTGVEKKVPSIQQFLSAANPQEFQALDGGNNEELASTLTKLPNLFWIHKTLFIALEGKASKRVIDAAMQIIVSLKKSANNLATMDASRDDDEEEELYTTDQQQEPNPVAEGLSPDPYLPVGGCKWLQPECNINRPTRYTVCSCERTESDGRNLWALIHSYYNHPSRHLLAGHREEEENAKAHELEHRETGTTPHSYPNPIQAWLLPAGKSYMLPTSKSYKDFFNPDNGNTAD